MNDKRKGRKNGTKKGMDKEKIITEEITSGE